MGIYVKIHVESLEFIQSSRPLEGFHKVPPQYTLLDVKYLNVVEDETEILFTLDVAKRDEDKVRLVQVTKFSEAKEALVTSVYGRMYKVFNTQDPHSASANLETWKHMIDNPSKYIGQGLKNSSGELLETEDKVVEYASVKVEEAFDYGIWRLRSIQEFEEQYERE